MIGKEELPANITLRASRSPHKAFVETDSQYKNTASSASPHFCGDIGLVNNPDAGGAHEKCCQTQMK